MLKLSEVEVKETILQSTSKRISENRVGNLAEKLVGLAKQSYSAISKTSPMIEEVKYNGSIISVVGKTTVEIIELFKYTQKVP